MNKKNITNFHLKNAIHRTMKDSIKMHRCAIVMPGSKDDVVLISCWPGRPRSQTSQLPIRELAAGSDARSLTSKNVSQSFYSLRNKKPPYNARKCGSTDTFSLPLIITLSRSCQLLNL